MHIFYSYKYWQPGMNSAKYKLQLGADMIESKKKTNRTHTLTLILQVYISFLPITLPAAVSIADVSNASSWVN